MKRWIPTTTHSHPSGFYWRSLLSCCPFTLPKTHRSGPKPCEAVLDTAQSHRCPEDSHRSTGAYGCRSQYSGGDCGVGKPYREGQRALRRRRRPGVGGDDPIIGLGRRRDWWGAGARVAGDLARVAGDGGWSRYRPSAAQQYPAAESPATGLCAFFSQ